MRIRRRGGVRYEFVALIINTHPVLTVDNSIILWTVKHSITLYPRFLASSSDQIVQHASSKFGNLGFKVMLIT